MNNWIESQFIDRLSGICYDTAIQSYITLRLGNENVYRKRLSWTHKIEPTGHVVFSLDSDGHSKSQKWRTEPWKSAKIAKSVIAISSLITRMGEIQPRSGFRRTHIMIVYAA